MIKKRNLDPSLIQWIMSVTGLGPGVGELKYVVPAASSTSQYRTHLQSMGVSDGDMYLALADAENALVGYRNDVALVMPGTDTVTASLTWDKPNTHIIGLAGPLSQGGMGTGALINCETTAVESVIDVQGSNCQFHNIQLRNVAANGGNLCGLKVSTGVCFYAKNCHFSGQGAATQIATAGNCAVWFYTASGGKPWGATFDNCKIGDAGEIVRTAGPIIYFSGGTALTAKYIDFVDCMIEGWSQTAGCPAVEFNENYCIDRWVRFKRCEFFNYYVNNVTTLTQVFDNDCGTTFKVLLHDTCQTGWAAWNSDGLQYVFTDSAASGATGGLMTATT